MQETSHIRDREAERAVLCGILHEPIEMFRQLAKIGLTSDDFGHYMEMESFEILKQMWSSGKKIDLGSIYFEFRTNLPTHDRVNSGPWICDLWLQYWWDHKMQIFWVNSPLVSSFAQRGLAAAAKVKWLSARRNAIHRANQVIRDARDGISGPEHFEEYE